MYQALKTFVSAALLAAMLLAGAALGTQAQAARNVLLIIADDMGIDVSTFYPTTVRRTTSPPAPPMPNLSSLRQKGVLFRNAWANTECSPTRATIFTGRYGFRTGVGAWIRDGYPVLSKSETSLPEVFKARSGSSRMLGHVGKWHLTFIGPTEPNLHGWPHYAGPGTKLTNLSNFFSWPKVVNGVSSTSTTYATTDQVNETIKVIQRAKSAGKPYVTWVALNTPHSPYHKPPNALHSRDSLPTYTSGMNPRPYYEAMIESMDTEIGRLLKAVDLATTTVIFVGDNGTPESVIASPYPKKGKSTIYEGGIRVPLLIAGAGVASPGRIVNGLANTVDLFPTVLELAGVQDWRTAIPSGVKIDGVSLMPYIKNTGTARTWAYAERFTLNYNEQYQRAIRNGRYKLIKRAGGGRQFFDLEADPFETKNLLQSTLTDAQKSNLSALDSRMNALLASR